MGKSKEDYLKQFAEKSRPVSDVSPIKTELESIINNKIYESNGNKQILITPKATQDVYRSNEEEPQKIALENDFVKKKQSEFVQELHEGGPISVAAGDRITIFLLASSPPWNTRK